MSEGMLEDEFNSVKSFCSGWTCLLKGRLRDLSREIERLPLRYAEAVFEDSE